MSFQTFVTERLADLTAKYNALITNAKQIFELPVQNNLDPSSLIHVSRDGTSESLSVQKIIDTIQAGDYDQLLSIGEITVSGTSVTFPANALWVIDDAYYQNIASINRPITLTATGFYRIDIAVANTSNDIVIVQGDETEGIAIRPNIPINTVLVTQINVNDTGIVNITPPVIGDAFVKKLESQDFIFDSGVTTIVDVVSIVDDRSSIVLYGSVIELKSLQIPNEYVRPGKPHYLKNKSGHDITVMNLDGSGNFQYYFSSGENLVLKNGEIVEFNININDGRLEYVGSSISSSSLNSLIVEEFTWTSGSQTFTLLGNYSQVYSVVVQLLSLKSTQYTLDSPNKVTILDPLDPGDFVRIIWSSAEVGVQPYYTQAETDGLVADKEDIANKVSTITGNETSVVKYPNTKAIYDAFDNFNSVLDTKISRGLISGDSTIASYSGQLAIVDYLLLPSDIAEGNSLVNIAVPGNTITQQKDAWLALSDKTSYDYVIVQIGLNDVGFTETDAAVIARLQDYIDTINLGKKTDCKIIIGSMNPAKQRWIDSFGEIDGATSQAQWFAINQSIMGFGSNPITGVDLRQNTHTIKLNDGLGNLAGIYDMGDYIHENNLARQIIAGQYRISLNNLRFLKNTLPFDASMYEFEGLKSYGTISLPNVIAGIGFNAYSDGSGVKFIDNGYSHFINTSNDGKIRVSVSNNNTDGYGATPDYTDVVTINSKGDVGLGTDDPTDFGLLKNLSLNGKNGSIIELKIDDVLKGYISLDVNSLDIYSFGTKPINLITNGVVRFSISGTGDVTIAGVAGTVDSAIGVDSNGKLLRIPSKITITTSSSITTATTDSGGIGQDGKHVIIDNGSSAINITCNGGVTTSYGKINTGAITFVQGSGRTLVQLTGTAVLNGIAGSKASLWSHGTTDYLEIINY